MMKLTATLVVSGKKKWVKQGAILTDIFTEKGVVPSDGFRQKEMGYVLTVGGVRQEEMDYVWELLPY